MKKIMIAALIVLSAAVTARTTAESSQKTQKPAPSKAELIVGEDILIEDITEFYYTEDSSAFPPYYQRYRFYTEKGKYYFYHETREGEEWPLTEKHIAVKGTIKLSEDEWDEFFDFLKDGTVKRRGENIDSGGSGPWLYLYWDNDGGEYREFTFSSREKLDAFEEYCERKRGS